MSSGERRVSGRRGFASEAFGKRPPEKSSPVSSFMVLTQTKPRFADGSTVGPRKISLWPSERAAQSRPGAGKDHRDSIEQDRGRTVGFSKTNETKAERG